LQYLRIHGKYFIKQGDYLYKGHRCVLVIDDNNMKIDLILLDILMPVPAGFSILKKILETLLIPVIMLSAKRDQMILSVKYYK